MEKHRSLWLALLLSFFGIGLQAQPSKGGIPPSFNLHGNTSNKIVSQVPAQYKKILTTPDRQALYNEDFERQKNGASQPPRVSVILPVHYTTQNSGEWTTLETGEQIWRLQISAPNAIALSLLYDRFYLPKGSKLFIYSANGGHVLGAYTSENNPKFGPQFATEKVAGDELILEYVAPFMPEAIQTTDLQGRVKSKAKQAVEQPDILISGVTYAYNEAFISIAAKFYDDSRTMADLKPVDPGWSGSCMVNINCSEGIPWQTQKKGVAAMLQIANGEELVCSGTLLNNTSEDLTPYFLTAYHCSLYEGVVATDAEINQWAFYFHWESPDCDNVSTVTGYKTMVGAQRLAASNIGGGADGLLLRLNEPIPADYDVYFNGWDRQNTPPKKGVVIHHPKGDIKKISTYLIPAVSDTWIEYPENGAAGAHWMIYFSPTDHGHGVTEAGSSGSPMFNQNGLVVGTLTGGGSNCEVTSGRNFFGKLWWHWDQSPREGEWMKTYLDPENTGVTTLQGKYVSTDAVANFYLTKTELYASEEIVPVNQSYNATSYEWKFEGGIPATSTEKSPKVKWNTPGLYNITLIVNGEAVKTRSIRVFLKGNVQSVDIGSGTATAHLPLGATSAGVGKLYTASLYKASELEWIGDNDISALAWSGTTATTKERKVTIYLKHMPATLTDLSGYSAYSAVKAGATKMAEYLNVITATGFNEFKFNRDKGAFRYNPDSSLLVIVETDLVSNGTVNPRTGYMTMPGSVLQWTEQYKNAITDATRSTLSNNRPNIRITRSKPALSPKADFTADEKYMNKEAVLEEGFEDTAFPPAGWSIKKTNPGNTWIAGNISSQYFSEIDPLSKQSATILYDDGTRQDEWLITPPVKVVNDMQLQFYAGYSGNWLDNAHLECKISADNGVSWLPLWTTGAASYSQQWAFHKVVKDLSEYTGQTVKIAWQYVGLDGDVAAVDGVLLYTPDPAHYTIYEGETIQLIDKSSGPPVMWQWDNLGGNPVQTRTSTGEVPAVSYPLAGIYDLSLTVSNTLGTNTKSMLNQLIVKKRKPVSDFFITHGGYNTMEEVRYLAPGDTVRFYNESKANPVVYAWNLPGATPPVSSAAVPTGITYHTAGTYDVSLTTSNSVGQSVLEKKNLIDVSYNTHTIFNYYEQDQALFYTWAADEYITGSNNQSFMAFAEHFAKPAIPGVLTKVHILVQSAVGDKPYRIKIYSEGSDGFPDKELYTSPDFTPAELGGPGIRTVTFPTPVVVSGAFFVAVDGFGTAKATDSQRFIIGQTAARADDFPVKNSFYMNINRNWYDVSGFLGMNASLCLFPEFAYTQLVPAETAITVPNSAGTYKLAVASNVDYTISTPPAWYTVAKGSGADAGKLLISYQASASTAARSGNFTISGGGLSRTITCRQVPSANLNLTVNPKTLSVPAAAGSATVALSSNLTWRAKPDAPWITCTESGTNSASSYSIGYKANTTTAERKARITFSSGSVTATVDVTQAAGAAYLNVAPAAMNVLKAEGDQIIAVSSNVTWTATSNAEWLKAINNSGAGNANLYISCLANNALSRTGTITVSAGSLTKTVTVEQDGLFQITAAITPSNAGTVTGTGLYARNENATLKAIPGRDYGFKNWTKGDEVMSAARTYVFTVAEPVALTARFYKLAVYPVQNLQGSYSAATQRTTLTWAAPCCGPVARSYVVYANGIEIETTTGLRCIHTNPILGATEYCVKAVTDEGDSDTECIDVVRKSSQAIHWLQALGTMNYSTTPITLTAITTSELPVTYTSGNPDIVKITGNQLQMVGAGASCVITASQAGNDGYEAAVSVTKVIDIVNAPIALTGFKLNKGAAATSNRFVSLDYTVEGGVPTHYMVSEYADFKGAAWQACGGSPLMYSFMSNESDMKTVYLKMRNEYTTATAMLSASILYKAAPAKLKLDAYKINGGAVVAKSRTVTLNHTIESGIPKWYSASEQLQAIGQTWAPYLAAPEFSLSEGAGMKEVFFAVANETDTSGIAAASIYLDEAVTVEFHGLTAKLYPNPVKDIVQVDIEDGADAVTMTVYSITGEIYLSKTFTAKSFNVDLSKCPTGTLLVKLTSGKNYVVKQLIKR